MSGDSTRHSTQSDVTWGLLHPMPPKKHQPFDAYAFLESANLDNEVVTYAPGDVVFTQGDPCDSVMYLRAGEVRLSVLSRGGKEAVVATLGAGEFFGEGALAAQKVRLESASATMDSTVLVVPKAEMVNGTIRADTVFSRPR